MTTNDVSDTGPAQNTDREIWREVEGDAYAPSIHVTQSGGIGIDVGGVVHVMPVDQWHALASRHHQPVNEPGEWQVEAEEEERIDALRLTAFRTNDPNDLLAYWGAASQWFQDRDTRRLRAASIPKVEPGVKVSDGDRSIALASWAAFYNLACEFGKDITAYADAVNEVLDHDATIRAALEPVSLNKGEAFGTAWQTSYTGDEWHFARAASFSPHDLERGIVKNVTPLYAAPQPTPVAPVSVTITPDDLVLRGLIAEARMQCAHPNIHFQYSDGPRVMSGLADALEATLSAKPGEEG